MGDSAMTEKKLRSEAYESIPDKSDDIVRPVTNIGDIETLGKKLPEVPDSQNFAEREADRILNAEPLVSEPDKSRVKYPSLPPLIPAEAEEYEAAEETA
jgi:hypothetical protein